MAGRKMNRKMEVSDVVSVLREVLEGGPPSQEDLFKSRYKPARGSDFAYDVFDARIDGTPGTCGYDAFPKLCERVRAARGARLAVALMLLVPSAGLAAVAKARWERVDLRGRQWTVPQAHRIPGRPAGERTFKLSSQAMRVLEAARQLALGNDDGAALVFERRRKLASSNSTTDSDYRHLMDLPAPRARRGTPRGLGPRGRPPVPTPAPRREGVRLAPFRRGCARGGAHPRRGRGGPGARVRALAPDRGRAVPRPGRCGQPGDDDRGALD